MLECVNRRGFCWRLKVLSRTPLRGRMSVDFPITVDCSKANKDSCGDVKDADGSGNPICKQNSG